MRKMKQIKLKPGQPQRLQIQLSHFRQRYNWDCGIACILMILHKKLKQNLLNNFSVICAEEGFNKSTWTIDLCYLLKRYEVMHHFYTITLGVHPGHKGNAFYDSILTKDEERVNRKFDTADRNGLVVRKDSINMQTLLDHLINGPAIVLTNARLLNCDVCKFNKISKELRQCCPWPVPYQGHYIVVCGYDLFTRKVYYRNPSFTDRVCAMSIESLEEARKSYGTDEDVILVYM